MNGKQNDRIAAFLLVAIATGGLILRAWGLGWGLPFAESRPDEFQIITRALGYGGGDFNPHFFNYPSLFSYLLFGAYGIYTLVLFATGAIHSAADVLIRFAVDPTAFYLIARWLSLVFGLSTIIAVYGITRKVFNRRAALAGALFLAVAYIHVRDSHFGVTDVAMTFGVTLSYYFIIEVYRRGLTRDYLGAAIAAGLAASLKYNAALLAMPILLAHLVSSRNAALPFIQRLLAGRLWLAAACMAGAFFATSPFVLIDWASFIRDFTFEMRHLSGAGETPIMRGWLYHLRVSLFYGVGPLMFVAAIVGAIKTYRRDARAAFILFFFPALYFLAIGQGYTVFVRYAIPIVPFICILAGIGVFGWEDGVVTQPWRRRAGWAIMCIACGCVAVPPLARSIQFDRLISRADTRTSMAESIARIVPGGATIGWVGTLYGRPKIPESAASLQQQFDQIVQRGGTGRLIKARIAASRTRGGGYTFASTDRLMFAGSDTRPSWILQEECAFPLAYYIRLQTIPHDALLREGYVQVYRAGEKLPGFVPEKLGDAKSLMYDWQDSLYAPYAHPGAVANPGPVLTLWKRTE